jgi:hypothetical protein
MVSCWHSDTDCIKVVLALVLAGFKGSCWDEEMAVDLISLNTLLLTGHGNASEGVHRPSALLIFGEHAREIITTGKLPDVQPRPDGGNGGGGGDIYTSLGKSPGQRSPVLSPEMINTQVAEHGC